MIVSILSATGAIIVAFGVKEHKLRGGTEGTPGIEPSKGEKVEEDEVHEKWLKRVKNAKK